MKRLAAGRVPEAVSPTPLNRRAFLAGSSAAMLALAGAAARGATGTDAAPSAAEGARASERADAAREAARHLAPITGSARPIEPAERAQRLAHVQRLMQQQRVHALLLEPGASLEYFTGITWWRSERTTAALIPAEGAALVVTPAFEEPSVRETLAIPGEVRIWNEHESPFARLAQGIKDLKIDGGRIAVEETVRFFLVEGVRRAAPGIRLVPADPLVRPCRMQKSSAEIALMQIANEVTLEALRFVHRVIEPGMRAEDIESLVNGATEALGGSPEFALVLLNEASAFPHGSHRPQSVREGSVVLLDCGCTVHGYQSDISRTFVHGEPTARQRTVWDTVKRGQDLALETARLGQPVGHIDDAVRSFYERKGWGPGYRLPGLPHRTGHGIGLDGHESPYLVHGDDTPLAAGMCFSDEPGLYTPGEFGVRLEDCWHMTEKGPELFTRLARSLEDPI
jgi:Xaa-Pro dipeptidase